MGYKVFTAGEEALASDINSLLMSQTVARFTNAAQRTSQLTAPVLNQVSMLDSAPGRQDVWNGSAWEAGTAGAELAYNQITASFSVTNTSGSPQQVIAGTSRAYDGQPVNVESFIPNLLAPAAGVIYLLLWDGSTPVSVFGYAGSTTGQVSLPVLLRHRLTPAAGIHAYTLVSYVSTPSGTITAGTGTGGTNAPAFIRVSRA